MGVSSTGARVDQWPRLRDARRLRHRAGRLQFRHRTRGEELLARLGNPGPQFADRLTRALSVAMPVFAYICRYSFEIITNAMRDLSDSTQWARRQMLRQL